MKLLLAVLCLAPLWSHSQVIHYLIEVDTIRDGPVFDTTYIISENGVTIDTIYDYFTMGNSHRLEVNYVSEIDSVLIVREEVYDFDSSNENTGYERKLSVMDCVGQLATEVHERFDYERTPMPREFQYYYMCDSLVDTIRYQPCGERDFKFRCYYALDSTSCYTSYRKNATDQTEVHVVRRKKRHALYLLCG